MDALALTLLALAATLVVLHAETCRRLLFRREDPRTMAAFRIACGVCTIGWTLELWPLQGYLFSDEGLFLTDTARQVFAPSGFAGIADGSADGEPAGPLDVVAVLQLVASPRQSLLFFWDDPFAVRVHVLVLVVAAVLLTLGLATAVTKWITLLAFHSLAMRNSIFWAGEQVFWNFMLLLCLSRCGRAWSIDAWLRGRWGRAPADPAIPGWPRVLALLQLIPLFTANGLAKSGEMWAAGDTFHYLLMHPDFQRFDATALAQLGSTTIFRLMTWGAHLFELLFPLAIVGVVVRFGRAEGIAPLSGWRARAARVAWIGAAAATAALAVMAYPGRERSTLCFAVVIAAAIAVAVLAALGRRAEPLHDWLGHWVLSRRLWVTLLLIFTGHLLLLTSIGWFVPLTMATALLFFDGQAVDSPDGDDARALPSSALWLALGALAVGAIVAFMIASANLWSATIVAVGVALALWMRRNTVVATRRFMVGWFCGFHVAAVTIVLLPAVDPEQAGRAAIEAPFRRWHAHAHTGQTWRMFAPDGARSVHASDVELTDAAGQTIAIGSGLPPEGPMHLGRDKREKTGRRIAHGEGQGTWYRKWHGRYLCRRWAHDTGELPTEVTLFATSRPIAPPEVYASGDASEVASVESQGSAQALVWQARCAVETQAQPPNSTAFVPWIKRRAQTWSEQRANGSVPDLPWPLAILLAPWFVLALPRREQRQPNQDRG